MSPGTNITSWITYFVGGCLQGALLTLCIYYHYNATPEYVRIDDARQPTDGTPLVDPKEQADEDSESAAHVMAITRPLKAAGC